jgi:hypothetical protein
MHSYFLFLIFGIFIYLPAFPRSEQVSHFPEHWPTDQDGSLKLPGISLNPAERFLDINATVCLDNGLLELVACTKNTKEHESIVVLNARPMHIHAALLLLKAKPGRPAMQKVIDNENLRWVPVTPTGEQIEVSLVFQNKKGKLEEFSISTFVSPTKLNEFEGFEVDEKIQPFPKTFLFAGSHFSEEKNMPRKYACEYSGNVISISTFGDELLCLPGIHGHANDGLAWEVNSEKLPKVGTNLSLRLRLSKSTQESAKD